MSKKILQSMIITIIAFLLFSCEVSTGPITGMNTTTFAELTNGNYRGITGYGINRLLYDITISTDEVSKTKKVELKIYNVDIANNEFYKTPYLWLEGVYNTFDYYSDYSDDTNQRMLYNWPLSRFEFTQNKIANQELNPSTYNSDFTYSLENTPNANNDKLEIVYKATINSNVKFCKNPYSTESYKPLATWMTNLVLTKTTL